MCRCYVSALEALLSRPRSSLLSPALSPLIHTSVYLPLLTLLCGAPQSLCWRAAVLSHLPVTLCRISGSFRALPLTLDVYPSAVASCEAADVHPQTALLRWVLYKGELVKIGDVVTRPTHSLVDQALNGAVFTPGVEASGTSFVPASTF